MAKMRKNISTYAGPAGERRDCSVRALVVVSGLSYKDAHARFKAAGRVDNQGTPTFVSARVHLDLGYTKLDVPRVPAKFPKYAGHTVRPSIAKFARENKKGVFILHTSSHALALVDGVVHDWRWGAGSRGQVERAWRVK